MARNIALQVLRGALVNLPALGDGEFYLATDTGQLFVGFLGGTLQVATMALQIQDPNSPGQIAAVQAKGVQGTYLLAVQDAKDTGRTKVVLTLNKAAAIAAEALVTLTIKKGTAATSTGTSYTVTAGKTLRIQSILLSVTDSTTAAVWNVAARLREGAAAGGAVAITSDIIALLEVGNNAATLQTNGQASVDFPDGLEITSGQIIGFSELASAADGAVTICLVGFEY